MLNHITILSIESTITVNASTGYHFDMYNRKTYGLSFCMGGKIIYSHKDKRCVSDPNHVVLLPKGGYYSLDCIEEGSFPVINFTCAENLNILSPTLISIRDPSRYYSQFQMLKNLLIWEQHRSRCFSILYDIFSSIVSDNVSANRVITSAVKYLEKNIDHPSLSNKAIADSAGVSEVYFRKLFTSVYGISPKQYIINIRIRRAKQLLAEGTYTIGEISEKCGFSSAYYFSKAFHSYTGMSPTQFMNETRSTPL